MNWQSRLNLKLIPARTWASNNMGVGSVCPSWTRCLCFGASACEFYLVAGAADSLSWKPLYFLGLALLWFNCLGGKNTEQLHKPKRNSLWWFLFQSGWVCFYSTGRSFSCVNRRRSKRICTRYWINTGLIHDVSYTSFVQAGLLVFGLAISGSIACVVRYGQGTMSSLLLCLSLLNLYIDSVSARKPPWKCTNQLPDTSPRKSQPKWLI